MLDDLVYFLRNLAVPTPAPLPLLPTHAKQGAKTESPPGTQVARIEQGHLAFSAARCATCHADGPGYKGLYSDLLLHDLGAGLADGRREHLAGGRDWRTAPLAGLRLRKRLAQVESYLHDGRARSLEEAVLWHGGEARNAQQIFVGMSAAQRQALLAFLETR